jgi:hypothetical protein
MEYCAKFIEDFHKKIQKEMPENEQYEFINNLCLLEKMILVKFVLAIKSKDPQYLNMSLYSLMYSYCNAEIKCGISKKNNACVCKKFIDLTKPFLTYSPYNNNQKDNQNDYQKDD